MAVALPIKLPLNRKSSMSGTILVLWLYSLVSGGVAFKAANTKNYVVFHDGIVLAQLITGCEKKYSIPAVSLAWCAASSETPRKIRCRGWEGFHVIFRAWFSEHLVHPGVVAQSLVA